LGILVNRIFIFPKAIGRGCILITYGSNRPGRALDGGRRGRNGLSDRGGFGRALVSGLTLRALASAPWGRTPGGVGNRGLGRFQVRSQYRVFNHRFTGWRGGPGLLAHRPLP